MADYWNSDNTMRIPAKKQTQVERYEAPPTEHEMEMQVAALTTYQDCVLMLEKIARLQLSNKLPPGLCEAHSKRVQELMNAQKMRDTMSPEWQMKNAFSVEAGIQAAREMTPDRVKEILLGRKFKLLVKDMSLPGEAIPLPKVEEVVDVEAIPVFAPDAAVQTEEMKTHASDLRQQMKDIVAEKRRQRGKE